MHIEHDDRFEGFVEEYEKAYEAAGRPSHAVVGALLFAALTPDERFDAEDRELAKKYPALVQFMRESIDKGAPLNWFCGCGFQELQVLDGMQRLTPLIGTMEDQEWALRQLFGGRVSPQQIHIVPPLES